MRAEAGQRLAGRRFTGRPDAGHELARRLWARLWGEPAREDVLVLGASPGGLVVAAPVAAALQAELDVVAVTPIAIPDRFAHSVGAVTVTGPPVLARRSLARAGLSAGAVDEAVSLARRRSRSRELALRGFAPPPMIAGRTVIIVDDGLGIGVNALAAVRRVRRHGPARLLFATPVCVKASARALAAALAGEVISVITSPGTTMAGIFYADLPPVSDSEIRPLLSARRDGKSDPQPSRQQPHLQLGR